MTVKAACGFAEVGGSWRTPAMTYPPAGRLRNLPDLQETEVITRFGKETSIALIHFVLFLNKKCVSAKPS